MLKNLRTKIMKHNVVTVVVVLVAFHIEKHKTLLRKIQIIGDPFTSIVGTAVMVLASSFIRCPMKREPQKRGKTL